MTHDLRCERCGSTEATGPVYPRSCACGGFWEPASGAGEAGAGRDPTPFWPDPRDPGLWWKREDLNPTGSFKDRGAEELVRVARASGARSLVVDSSGSAALAAAAAGARAGLPVAVHTPAGLPRVKRGALETLGARLVAEGTREEAAARAAGEAEVAFHVSHVFHPAFWQGTAGSGTEVLYRTGPGVPPVWVLPVGNGSLLFGLDLALDRAGRTGVVLVAVQSTAAPGIRAPGPPGRSRAAGINIGNPPRVARIREVLARRGGEVLEVAEEEIASAREALGRRGVAAEAAAAASLAGVRRLRARGEERPIAAWLTGEGNRE